MAAVASSDDLTQQQAAVWGRSVKQSFDQSTGLAGGCDGMAAVASSDDLTQTALRYQQALAGLQADPNPPAQESTAIVAATAAASTDATAAAAGYDEQTIAALYQYQALQATLMAQGGA